MRSAWAALSAGRHATTAADSQGPRADLTSGARTSAITTWLPSTCHGLPAATEACSSAASQASWRAPSIWREGSSSLARKADMSGLRRPEASVTKLRSFS